MQTTFVDVAGKKTSLATVHTLVIGSGAAGLNAAAQLRRQGIDDVLIVTEGLDLGTSINTGSDKQTYYKLSLCGEDGDSPRMLADSFFSGGSMHGDLALVEASLSARAFMNLVGLGVAFPQDKYGQFVGYKTDHDPRSRATSVGPYTSRDMCRSLIAEVKRLGVPVREKCNVVSLITLPNGADAIEGVGGFGKKMRVCGAVALDENAVPQIILANNVIFATGGPGGLYRTSVYPEVHTGGIGLALLAGATAQNLPESQYGLASIKFRWNVSGTYMQVVPRLVSTAADGASDAREFLTPSFASPSERDSLVFLKGYQWPFDSRKVCGGSSLVDLLVYIETELRGRRVFLDYRSNPEGLSLKSLSPEAKLYLENSKALQDTPLKRLLHMNPGAVELYREHGIDLANEMLEIAVCAQHNNGGLAANHWWESVNVKHLFPVGEVNGSHGVYRPGGAALNSGQVGGIRAAEYIAKRYVATDYDRANAEAAAVSMAVDISRQLGQCASTSTRNWREERDELQSRMSRAGAHVRSAAKLEEAVCEAKAQWLRISENGCAGATASDKIEALRTRQLCYAHLAYLEALLFMAGAGVGSRGSAMALADAAVGTGAAGKDQGGMLPHPSLGAEWRMLPENAAFREKVQETVMQGDQAENRWVPRRPIPNTDAWFETAWADFRNGKIYD